VTPAAVGGSDPSAERSATWAPRAALQWMRAEVEWAKRLVVDELRPRPGRMRTSVRMAFIAAVGAALTAALHIQGPLGPTTLWVALYASTSLMTASEGLLCILAYAVMLPASVLLAGILVETPWLLLPFIAVATAVMTYGFNRRGLTGVWFNVEVAFLDTFYLCIFDPHDFGWSVAYTFSGIALAIGVLVLFDTVLWPDPAEPALLRSLADTIDRDRERLAAIGRAYLDPLASAFPEPTVASLLNVQLPLFARARREIDDPQRDAILLAAVTNTERLHIEIERLLATARQPLPRELRTRLRPETEAVLDAIAAALRRRAQQAATGLTASNDPAHEQLATAIRSSLQALQAREEQIFGELHAGDAAAVANVAAINQGLRRIGERIIDRPLGHVYGVVFPKDLRPRTSQPFAADPALMRYSAKVGLAATLAFLVGVASNRDDLGVIVWTALIAGLPTYGATMRKTLLRITGAIMGGLQALLVIVVVSRNFDSLGPYFVAFFVVLFVAAYVGLSSGRLAYAGQQAGVSFVVAYAALGPSDDFYAPMWRVWGILLGLVIVAGVFLLVAPEYAGKSLVPRLKAILRSGLELLRPPADLTVQRVQELDMDVTLQLTEMLGIAEDARLEGRRSGVDPDHVIDAAGTLRRIAHRLSGIATARLTMSGPPLPAELETARAACDAALRVGLQSWLTILESDSDRRQLRTDRTSEAFVAAVAALHERFSASLQTLAAWPAAARSRILAESESYGRLAVLMSELDRQFMAIPVSASRDPS